MLNSVRPASPNAMPVDVQLAVTAEDLPAVPAIQDWAEGVIEALDTGECEQDVCIRVVDASESRELNRTWRNKDRPTNVLSFPADIELPEANRRILGDIVVCAPVVREEARQQGKTMNAHFAHMVVHGMLHLYGYDHELASDADVMEQLEREILGRFSVGDPYRETETA